MGNRTASLYRKSARTPRRPRRSAAATLRACIAEPLEHRLLLARVLYVDDSAAPGGNGQSWSTAHRDLQQVLTTIASPGDEIRVAQGTYKPTSTTDRSASFALKSGVAVLGGYAGVHSETPDARDIVRYPTTLSGDIGQPGLRIDNSEHILIALGMDAAATLDGFTVADGQLNARNEYYAGGAGLYIKGGSPIIRNCTFIDNQVDGFYQGVSGGAAIFNSAASPQIVGCSFLRNVVTYSSSAGGGAIANDKSSPVIARCFFLANKAGRMPTTGRGGAIWVTGKSTPLIAQCAFVGNWAGESAGAVAVDSSGQTPQPMLSHCTFVSNAATRAGGAVSSASSYTRIADSIFVANAASRNPQIDGVYETVNTTYSIVVGGYTGTGNINADPQFVRNPSPGPDLAWGTPDDDYGDLRLRLTSPAVDAADNAVAMAYPTDLDGNPRLQDIASLPDTGRGNAPIADMGPFEAQPHVQAIAGGPYAVGAGLSISLDGIGYSDRNLALSYAWDFDNDGDFDDAFGPNPIFSAAGLAPQALTVALRVTDAAGIADISQTTVHVVRPIYVDDSAAGANTGASWTDAFTDLQLALAAVQPFQTIVVAQGTYRPTSDTNRSATFQLPPSAALYGGYAGLGAANPDERNPARYPTILSGDLGVSADPADNSYHVLTAIAVDACTILDGFTIADGNANAAALAGRGGGLYISGGSPTIRDCTFTSNKAGLSNSSAGGGAVYMVNSRSAFLRTTFLRNATTDVSSLGGAIAMEASQPSFDACTFAGNFSYDKATAVLNRSSTPVFSNTVFVGNRAQGGGGGAVHNDAASARFSNCTFANNQSGSALSIGNASGQAVTVTNSILWGNIAGATGSGLYKFSYSIVQETQPGAGNRKIDPRFLRTPSPGPDATWGTPDDDYGDLRLKPDSPAIDAGSNTAAFGLASDLVGDPRFQDIASIVDSGLGTAPIVDMGAFEASAVFTASFDSPFVVASREAYRLSSTIRGNPVLPLSYAWDLDGDGEFDDAFVPDPIYSASSTALSVIPVAVRVTDAAGVRSVARGGIYIVDPLYVDDSATGANNGTSWANAFTSLKSALAVSAWRVVRVGQGTYRPTSALPGPFAPGQNARILGGYAGIAAPDPDLRDSSRFTTILSSITFSKVGSGTLLDGVTIAGGGMRIESADPIIRDVQFIGNTARDYGGAVYIQASSSPVFLHCSFVGNSVDAASASASGGGAIYSSASSPTLIDCSFEGNSVVASKADSGGGAIFNSGSSTTLTNCVFKANLAMTSGPSSGGGAIYNMASSATLTGCVFAGNAVAASGPDSGGGAIYNNAQSSALNLINCTLAANSARSGALNAAGGAIFNRIAASTLVNCIVWANRSDAPSPIVGSANITYSDIEGGWAGLGNIDADPLFVALSPPASDGAWETGVGSMDLRLRLVSPAIDSGNSAAVPEGMDIDIGGSVRCQDIPAAADQGAGGPPIVDMGAYEASSAPQALSGGPYAVVPGESIQLSGVGYSERGLSLSYAWDLDGDGEFDDAFVADPLLPSISSDATLTLRVTDAAGASAIDQTTLRLLRTIYVDDSATGADTGESWSDAYVDLRAALAHARPGQQIRVAQGTYLPTSTTDRTVSFELRNGVSLLGGYAGALAADPDRRDPSLYSTILSGNIGNVNNLPVHSFHVVIGTGISATTVLDGLTVTGGDSYGNPLAPVGAGLYLRNAHPVIRNCTFLSNSADNGGGLYGIAASPVLQNCLFLKNSASGRGAGVALVNSTSSLVNCVFNLNWGREGAGLFVQNATVRAINCTFAGNRLGVKDVAASCVDAALTLSNCIVWANDGSNVLSPGVVTEHSIVQGGWPNARGVDPLFVRNPSAYNDDPGILRLRPNSPAIDAGDNAAVPEGVLDDCVGHVRFFDLPSVPDSGVGISPIVDLGAYEVNLDPIANVGGPYAVLKGESIRLSGSVDGDPSQVLSCDWDLDGDGEFDDASVFDPRFFATSASGAQTLAIALRVTARSGSVSVDRTTIEVIQPVYVDDTATGANDGTSWHDAYTSFESVRVAYPETTICVAQGVYKPTTFFGPPESATFELRSGLTIYGGYAGAGAPDPNDRDVSRYPTVLSGDIGVVGDSADNIHSVLTIADVEDTLLDGFTIAQGRGSAGAGIYYHSGSVTFSNCIIRDNIAAEGAGFYCAWGSPTFINCAFLRNSAHAHDSGRGGGAMLNENATPTLVNCIFEGNQAGQPGVPSAAGGGAILNFGASPSLINCSFAGNVACGDSGGGAVLNVMNSSPSFTNCTFAANAAPAGGGAMRNDGSAPTLANCILWGNGPAPISSTDPISVSNCLVQGGCEGIATISLDPRFLRNPSPGSDNLWGTPDDDYGDLRLQPDSPAIDAGDDASLPASITTDLAGNPRFIDVPSHGDAAGPAVDMGANESPDPAFALTGSPFDDSFTLSLVSGDLRITSERGPIYRWSYAPASLSSLHFAGLAGEDSLRIDVASGAPVPALGLSTDLETLILHNTLPSDRLTLTSTAVQLNTATLTPANLASLLLDADLPLLQLTSLDLSASARLALAPGKLLRLSSLSLDDTASLDLADGALILQPDPAAFDAARTAIQSLIARARSAGQPWTGPGLISSAAAANPHAGLVFLPNRSPDGAPILHQFRGQPVDENSLLVAFALNGDADFTGRIDADDYFRIDQGRLTGRQGYLNGDFNDSGAIDADDYALIDAAFHAQDALIATAAPSALSALPSLPLADLPPMRSSPFSALLPIHPLDLPVFDQ